jgi:hypothetical protein
VIANEDNCVGKTATAITRKTTTMIVTMRMTTRTTTTKPTMKTRVGLEILKSRVGLEPEPEIGLKKRTKRLKLW